MLMLPTVAEAQHVILGEGSNFNSPYSYPSPYGTYYRNQRTQILVTKNELYSIGLVPGEISSIGFNVKDINDCSSMPNYTIKMKHSALSELSYQFQNDGFVTVWTNPDFYPAISWNDHILSTPFNWDGTNGIIIDICFDIIPGDYTENSSVYNTAAIGKCLYANNDFEVVCGTQEGNLVDFRPNIRFAGQLATCMPPISLNVSDLTNSSTRLSWIAGNSETEWIRELGLKGFTVGTGDILTTTENPHILTGLNSNTEYDFYVKAVCSLTDESYYAGPFTFKTACDPSGLPYSENFESTSILPECWTAEYLDWSSVYIDMSQMIGGDNSLNLYADGNSSIYISLPYFSQNLNELSLSFDALLSYGINSIDIGTISNPTDISTFNYLYSIELQGSTAENIIAYFGNSPILTGFLAIRYGIQNYYGNLYIDNVKVDEISGCPNPIVLSANSITENSAIVSWVDSGLGFIWDIEYGVEGFEQGTGTLILNHGAMSYILNGLEPQTTYDFYVRSHCSSENSEWSQKGQFRTACSFVDIPIAEDFDQIYDLPECWTFIISDINSNVSVQSWNAFSAPNSLYAYSSDEPVYIIFPKVQEDISSLRLKFYATTSSMDPQEVKIGTISDPNNLLSFTEYENIVLTDSYSFYSILFDSYVGTDTYVAIKIGDGSYSEMFLDNAVLQFIPDCFEPLDVSVTDIQLNSCLVSWSHIQGATEFDIEYGLLGFELGEGTIIENISNNYTLTGLEPSTLYDVYVRANCQTDGYSEWSTVYSFGTLCGEFDLPYSENFDLSNNLPLCLGYATSMYGSYSINEWNSSTFPNSLETYFDSSPAMISLPQFTEPINSLKIKFSAMVDWSPYTTLEIGTCSDPNDANTFSPLSSIALIGEWTTYEVGLTDYNGINEHIAIRYGMADSWGSFYLDDIFVNKAPSIASVDPYNEISGIEVCQYTGMVTVLNSLPATVLVVDDLDNEYNQSISWTVPGYSPNNPEVFTANGTFNLPSGVLQSDPPTSLELTTTVTVIICSGIEDIVGMENYTIFPNPNSGSFNLYINNQAELLIYDITGKLIVGCNLNSGMNNIEIPNLSHGLYNLIIKEGNQLVSRKMIVE